ncbi:MAG: PH domain-containing protein [Candidatus Paceibacterota bacterium]
MPIILRQNEKLIKAVRKHRSSLMTAVWGWPLLVIGLAVIRSYLNFDFFGYWQWVLVFSILIVAIIILAKYYIWRMNTLIITNQRIVENKQHGIFSKTVTELLYQDISEISYSKKGINASLNNFGDITIRTMSESEIIVEKISSPEKVVDMINQTRQHFAGRYPKQHKSEEGDPEDA